MKPALPALLFVLLAIRPAMGDDVTLAYRLDIAPRVMHVTLRYVPAVPDSTTFKYGNEFYGGMKDLIQSLVNLRASTPFKVDTSASLITVYHPGNTPVQISYDLIDTHRPEQRVVGEMFRPILIDTHRPEQRVVGEMFRPILTDGYFFSLSHTLFLNPQLDEAVKDSLTLSVTLDEHPAFPLFLSFAPELKPGETATLSLTHGMDALVTGASDLHIEKREQGGIQNYVVLRINEKTQANLPRFMNYFDAFLQAMTDFWGNLNGTYYALVASPFWDIDYHDISGTAFIGGFHVKYSGDVILANDEVVRTISHEIMHRYIGAGCVSMEDNNQWFDEGFTDYTTWYLLSACGIMPPESLGEMAKSTYEQLSANPVRNTPNGEIMKHFWENHDYEKLPYNRGALFAAYVDNRIGEQSQGAKTYRDFMRGLKALAEQKQAPLTVDDFVAVASAYMPKAEIEAAIDRYIMQGEMIPAQKLFK